MFVNIFVAQGSGLQGTPKSIIPFQRSVSNATIDTVVDDSVNELLQSLIPSPLNLTPPIPVETNKENKSGVAINIYQ